MYQTDEKKENTLSHLLLVDSDTRVSLQSHIFLLPQ